MEYHGDGCGAFGPGVHQGDYERFARMAANVLQASPALELILEPGDATRYELAVVHTEEGLVVSKLNDESLCFRVYNPWCQMYQVREQVRYNPRTQFPNPHTMCVMLQLCRDLIAYLAGSQPSADPVFDWSEYRAYPEGKKHTETQRDLAREQE